MAKVDIDPEEVLRFAGLLREFTAATKDKATQVNGRFKSLGSSWRDQEYERFAAKFDEAMRLIARFAHDAEKYHVYLSKIARAQIERQKMRP
jgi:hypothetical protein